MELKDKVAMVTGASKGIGRATALALAREGAHVAISARTESLLNDVAAEIEKLGRKALVFVGDMSVEDDIKAFVAKTAETFGHIDILVNNAGVGIFKPVAELSTDDWDTMFNLNVRGLFIATRECLPHLRPGRGFGGGECGVAGRQKCVQKWRRLCGHQTRRARFQPLPDAGRALQRR
ncbi:MAG: SDR family NAD(P)-dependent oxidoreductase [candidate division KSB1 bacterium]|nr:SDR family NAD(P)-dependent oxidoreductase [candidate division KSB1 bacterium]